MGQNRFQIIMLTLSLAGTSIMCSIFTPSQTATPSPEQKQATIASLQLTISAYENSAVTSTPVPTKGKPIPTMVRPASGSITGKLSYPSEDIPPMRVVAVNVDTGEIFSTAVVDQAKYNLDNVPVGTYHVLAYLQDANAAASQGAGYSQAVLCGLSVDCTDHTLVAVKVREGLTITEINPGDWYAPEGTFPPEPIE